MRVVKLIDNKSHHLGEEDFNDCDKVFQAHDFAWACEEESRHIRYPDLDQR